MPTAGAPLPGLMQRHELLVSDILRHAARHHGEAEILSRREDGSLSRTCYAALEPRARRLMTVLGTLGVRPGDRVGTLAMNSDRHLELYYGIAGLGAVCNTINPRLAPDDVAYIIGHAEDGVLFCDPCFLALVAAVAPAVVHILRAVVVLCDVAAMPQYALPSGIAFHCYESLMAADAPLADWPVFSEDAACGLCYTSGTTGRPKGVLYSHRSNSLHALAMTGCDALAARATDRIAVVVPMFHVNAWGLPYVAPMTGASLLMPGRQLDPASLLALMNEGRASMAVGVPTIWMSLLQHLRDGGGQLATLKRVFCGGAALPRTLVIAYAERGIELQQGWGLTESSPVVTINAPVPATLALEGEALLDHKTKQGRCAFGADVCVRDEAGHEMPHDGASQGEVMLRGHWIASGYYRLDPVAGNDGWFPTGDIGVLDAQGFVTLTDRSKDLIKSGGEWISSIAIENIAAAHPEVAEAAAIAVQHEKWGERPLLVVVARPGCALEPEALLDFCRARMPGWSVPDTVVVVESLPHGATGKVLKRVLRQLYGGPQT